MARGIWSGAISFGLINIPVQLMSSKQKERIHFRMLDKTDHSPIGYKQINKSTGREVQKKNIVKAYEYQHNQYVVLTEADFKKANPKATQTIDIEDFVELDDLDPLLFERPYYLVPGKNGEKGYVLLRKVLERTKKVAVARFVLRKKQHLVAIMPRGDYLICEILRFSSEIREVEEAKFLDDVDLEKVRISERELKMAEDLVAGMTTEWDPDKYKDTYESDLLKRIEQKIHSGDTEVSPEIEDEDLPTDTNVVDLMPLLEKSLKATGKPAKPSRRARSEQATSRSRKRTTKRKGQKAQA